MYNMGISVLYMATKFQFCTNVNSKSRTIIWWDVAYCSPVEVTDVSEDHTGHIFKVKNKAKKITALWLLEFFFDPEDGSSTFLRNVPLPAYLTSFSWRQ
jgi:hypothetical protein